MAILSSVADPKEFLEAVTERMVTQLRAIEVLVNMLDAISSDPDLEEEPDREPDVDDEPSLGFPEHFSQLGLGQGGTFAVDLEEQCD